MIMTTTIAPSSLLLTAATTTTSGKTTAVMPALSKATTISSIPVRAIPVPNTNKLILAGPCIVLRTATVAQQVQALRQEKKAAAAITAATTTTATAATVKTEPQTPELLRCKRRADLAKLGFPEAKPASVSRRNARERNRVKLVNQGFDTLREHVPNGKKNRKMSKVDTLRSAVDYIRQLQELIRDHDEKTETSPSGEWKETAVVTDDNLTNDSVGNDSDQDMDMSLASRLCDEEDDGDAFEPAAMECSKTTYMDNARVDHCDSTMSDNINNNNNKFVNFNVDSLDDMDNSNTRLELNGVGDNVPQTDVLAQVNPGQSNAVQNVNTVLQDGIRQPVDNLNSLNASLLSTLARTPSSGVEAGQTTSTTSSTPTITVITLPLQNVGAHSSNDNVFVSDICQSVPPSSSSPSTLGTMTTGSIATLTTLQGVGSLSGQGLTITQPCRRHLSFSDPETEGQVLQSEPRDNFLLNNQQQRQRQTSQQHISFTLLPEQNKTDLNMLNSNNHQIQNLLQQQIPMDQQQQQHIQQQPLQQSQLTTLSNLILPDQSASAALTALDQSAGSTSLPLTNNQRHRHPPNPLHNLVAPGNMTMMQPQLQVDQVPSPSLSTTSSHTSESSYESYESLGSLEEDLQDISNWITELCNSAQDINTHCKSTSFLSTCLMCSLLMAYLILALYA